MKLRIHNGGAELYFKVMWLLTVALYIFIPIEFRFLNLVFYGIHAITILVFALLVSLSLKQGKIDIFNGKRLIILLALSIILVFSALLSSTSISFSVHIIGILGFLEMLFAIFIIDKVDYTDTTESFVFWVNVAIALVFVLFSRTSFAYSDEIIGSLSLGYANPNATAIYLLMNIALLMLYTVRIQKLIPKLFVYALCTYLLYLLYETHSRTCLVAAVLIVAYILVAPKWKLPKILLPIFMLIPLVFLFFYAEMYKTGKYTDLTILGKEFYSGREGYFVKMLDNLKAYWLVGDVGQHPFENMHNGPLALLSSGGVIGYLLYLQFTGNTIRHYYQGKVTHTQTVALIVIFAAFIHSCSEAALVVGGANYSIVMATFYWLLKGSKDDYGKQKNAQ